jgi:hypothetical protein
MYTYAYVSVNLQTFCRQNLLHRTALGGSNQCKYLYILPRSYLSSMPIKLKSSAPCNPPHLSSYLDKTHPVYHPEQYEGILTDTPHAHQLVHVLMYRMYMMYRRNRGLNLLSHLHTTYADKLIETIHSTVATDMTPALQWYILPYSVQGRSLRLPKPRLRRAFFRNLLKRAFLCIFIGRRTDVACVVLEH